MRPGRSGYSEADFALAGWDEYKLRDGFEMAIAGHEREVVLKDKSRNPNIVGRERSSRAVKLDPEPSVLFRRFVLRQQDLGCRLG